MIKIIFAAFLLAPACLIQRLLFLSCSSILRFFFCKTCASAQGVLPVQTGLYRYQWRRRWGGGHSPPRLVLRCRSRIKILGNFFFGGQFCPTKMFSMPTQTPIFLPFPFFLETVKKERNRTIYVETFFFEIILLGTEKPFQYQ